MEFNAEVFDERLELKFRVPKGKVDISWVLRDLFVCLLVLEKIGLGFSRELTREVE